MTTFQLSIVLPTHNTLELTRACLVSLEPFGASEVVVVDDGSTDGTQELLAPHFPGVQWLRTNLPLGFTAAANRGLAAAKGELLLLLNSDTQILQGSARDLARRFAAAPRLGALGASLRNPDGSTQWSGGPFPNLAWFAYLGSGLAGRLRSSSCRRFLRSPSGALGGSVGWIPATAMVLRRAAWEEVGPFSSLFETYAQDLALCSSLRRKGWQLAIDSRFVVLHHLGGSLGRDRGAVGGQLLAPLWSDLLRWAELERGPRWARRARWALLNGARFRLQALQFERLWSSGADRARLLAEQEAVRQGLEALTNSTLPRKSNP